jgi:hypothetical protein
LFSHENGVVESIYRAGALSARTTVEDDLVDEEIAIRLTVPIPSHQIVGVPALQFTQWLPRGEKESLEVKEGRMVLRLWADLTCVSSIDALAAEDIPKHLNIPVVHVCLEVRVTGLTPAVARAMLRSTVQPSEVKVGDTIFESLVAEEGQIYRFVISTINRLIEFCKVELGQYWLATYPADNEYLARHFQTFGARIRQGADDNWVRWRPHAPYFTKIKGELDIDRLMDQAAWLRLQGFLSSRVPPDVVHELLAEAENLAGSERPRAAIMEAIAALEVALSRFSQSDFGRKLFSTSLAARVDVGSLKPLIRDKFGLRGSVFYLVPLLFTEEVLSTDMLTLAQEALNVRNEVVHHGRRTIDERKLRDYLRALRALCDVLTAYSDK